MLNALLPRLALIAVLAVTACTEQGDNDSLRVGRLVFEQSFGEEAEPRARPSRAELDQIRSALLALEVGENQPVFIVPIAKNGPYLTYLDPTRRGLVLQGGAISSTIAFGYDLKGLQTQTDDPIVNQTPLAAWPAVVDRVYQYKVRDGEEFIIALTCQFSRGESELLEIYELFFETVQVTETCVNAYRQVSNTYWVEAETGFIWRSEQWVSPKQPIMTVEIIRPFGG
ncbi:MAG: YjbF family lipoprotein [Pseudomonadota bacterium]